MSMLTDGELHTIAERVLQGAMVENWTRVQAALHPLWAPTGDAGDGYLLIVLLIHVTLDALPRVNCPVHGEGCAVPLWTVTRGGMAVLPPELAADYPAESAFVGMMAAEVDQDSAGSVRIFCAAAQSRLGPEVLWLAIRTAGSALRRNVAGLQ